MNQKRIAATVGVVLVVAVLAPFVLRKDSSPVDESGSASTAVAAAGGPVDSTALWRQRLSREFQKLRRERETQLQPQSSPERAASQAASAVQAGPEGLSREARRDNSHAEGVYKETAGLKTRAGSEIASGAEGSSSFGAQGRAGRKAAAARSSSDRHLARFPGGASSRALGAGEQASLGVQGSFIKGPAASQVQEAGTSSGERGYFGANKISVTRADGAPGTVNSAFFVVAPERPVPAGIKAIITVLKTENAGSGKVVYFSDNSRLVFPKGTEGGGLNACDQAVFLALPVVGGQRPPDGKRVKVEAVEKNSQGSLVTFSDGSVISYRSSMPGYEFQIEDEAVLIPKRYGKFITVAAVKENQNEDKVQVTFSDGSRMEYGPKEFGYHYRKADHAILLAAEPGAVGGPEAKKVFVRSNRRDDNGNQVAFSDGTQIYYSREEAGYAFEQGDSASLVADPHCKQVKVQVVSKTAEGSLVTFSDSTQIFFRPGQHGYAYNVGQEVIVARNNGGGHDHSVAEGESGVVAGDTHHGTMSR